MWAERVGDRLKHKATQLGVDLLFCLTRQWLRDNKWLNLYAWWPGRMQLPVLIFSAAGFDALPPAGPETSRAITNSLVCCLAGFYGDRGTHDRGGKDCPLYFDENRDYGLLTGRQQFDAACRRVLADRLGSKLPALDALLNAF